MEENKPLENLTPETPVLSETLEVAPTIPVVEQNKKPWTKIVILLIVILLGCAGLVFAGIEIQKRQASSLPTPTPEVIATPTLDPTADWQTYTNSKYNFSFKYPIDWKVTSSPVTDNEFSLVVDQKSNTSEAGLVPIRLIVNMAKNEKGNSFSLLSVKEAEAYYLKSFSSSFVVRKDIAIAGRPAVSITGLVAGPGPSEGSFLHYTLVQLNNEVLVIQLGQKSYQSVFDQILSTFKFLDEAEKVDTSNWKTYTNTKMFAYQIKYPENWFVGVFEDLEGERKDIIQFSPTSKKGITSKGMFNGVTLYVHEQFVNDNYDSWLKKYNQSSSDERTFIDNLPASIAIVDNELGYHKSISFGDKNKELYSIYINLENKNDLNLLIFDQMISTFKFTN